ncbi:MAG: DUF1848 domain-containing protein [Syntrophobacteraceae bacterium]|jgi:hypothetical protein|nr:DUF1848 domain-containing protein [Syntrophobacteraceae bacterium]
MIISASRRTDIPAFYSQWFMNRIRAGYCLVVNPFNAGQVTRVSLDPRDVDVIVFWTRHPRPMFPHLPELDRLGYRYTFQYSLLGYPRIIDPSAPPLMTALSTFRELSRRIGPERITWRYDPVFLSSLTDPSYHGSRFTRIAEALSGLTRLSVISMMERYRKVEKGLKRLETLGLRPLDLAEAELDNLLEDFAGAARRNGMRIRACASGRDFSALGIEPGRCIDAEALSSTFGAQLAPSKDPSQRRTCGCTVSRDIGAYDTCVFGCVYCYATSSLERARDFRRRHDPDAESLKAHLY